MLDSVTNSRCALITGASGGLGTQLALQLATMNYNLVLTSRSVGKLEELKSQIQGLCNVEIHIIPSDLSKRGAARDLYQACRDRDLEVELLINNAGRGMSGAAIDQDVDNIEDLLALNIVSPTTLCRLFAADMKSRGVGYILNIGSLVGNQPTPFFGSYAASKAYLHSYAVSLSYELRNTGVTVTSFMAGYIKTNFDQNANISNERYLDISEKNAQTPDIVARLALKALFKRQMVAYSGTRNTFIALIARMLPQRMKAFAVWKIMLRMGV